MTKSAESKLFYNREISWLRFNERVLAEADNQRNPYLERMRFLSISASNLDEFRRVRLAGIKAQITSGISKKSIDGLTPQQQLDAINSHIKTLVKHQNTIWNKLLAELNTADIHITGVESLDENEKKWLENEYNGQILPNIWQHIMDTEHPIPFIPNGAIAIFARYTNPKGLEVYKLIRLSRSLPRFIEIEAKGRKYVKIEDAVMYFAELEEKDLKLQSLNVIRVLRDGDLALEDKAEDLFLTFENALVRRRQQAIVAIEYSGKFKRDGLGFWASIYNLGRQDFINVKDMPVGLAQISKLIHNEDSSLLYPKLIRRIPKEIEDYQEDIFALIKKKDFLLHHPYDRFDPVVELLNQAAVDPKVISIQQTLYRTSSKSPIVDALKLAAENGKNVMVMIELKARFDEQNNLKIARSLEELGARVLFGHMRLKTHAKLMHIRRLEDDKIVQYTHIGTGNYHPINAKIYTDISYFTAKEAIGDDVDKIFNFIVEKSEPIKLDKLCYSPHTIAPKLLDLIDKEIHYAKQGKPAHIWAKMNSLVETDIILKLYEASKAGVQITLNIRGICTLKAGVKGLSENIKVYSVIGRFLEHSRLFAFGNGHKINAKYAKIYIASADWMHRNLHRRIEAMAPIEDIDLKEYLLKYFIDIYESDNLQSWRLQNNGEYIRMSALKADEAPISCQEEFIEIAEKQSRGVL